MNRLRPDDDDVRFIRRVVIVIVIAGVTCALYLAGDLLILAFGSMLGAVAVHAVAEFCEEKLRVPPRVAVGMGMATGLAALAFLVWLFTVQFGEQIGTLFTELPRILDQWRAELSRSPVGATMVDSIQAAFAGSRISQEASGFALGSIELVLNFIVLIIGSLFFAANPRVYERGFLLLIPRSKRPAVADALDDLGHTLRLWLRAQLILMTSMGVLVGVGLYIAGVPSSAALGLLAGISEFIPYVGPTAAMLPALGLAATAGAGQVAGALATYAVVRLIQSNFITPYIQNRIIDIPPAITLFAILSIGYVFGLFGLFFSAAILVTAYTLIRSLYLREVLGEPIERPGGDEEVNDSPGSAFDSDRLRGN
ncbi:MAG TPA: AI-2E family transporter [Sphingomonas sp.]|nr:AI-2E family transporter [Sphingomonas sp.]